MHVTEYKCPCCGAALKFGAEDQQMRCEYCENTFTLEAVQACQTSEPEQDTFDWSTGSAGWSQEEQEAMRAFHCPSCGGELLTEATTAATFCPYCGSPAILPGRVSESFRPDRIIPFQLRREEAQEAFLRFCTGKRLLPKHFLTSQRLEQVTGMYVPFWIFDCGVEARARYRATRVRFPVQLHQNRPFPSAARRRPPMQGRAGGRLPKNGQHLDGSH